MPTVAFLSVGSYVVWVKLYSQCYVISPTSAPQEPYTNMSFAIPFPEEEKKSLSM